MVLRYAQDTFIIGVSLFLLFLKMSVAQANEVEKWLLMPGEVVTSHSDFEADCGLCHSPLSDTAPIHGPLSARVGWPKARPAASSVSEST